jgi:small subunit ribosomal protein S16
MLAIRLQRTGRKGHAMFRVVVQESRVTPGSGKVVASLGSYDPHTKATTLVKDKAAFYLEHGAQPSPRVAGLFEKEGIALPAWVKKPAAKQGALRNPEKLRKNQPKEVAPAVAPEEASTEVTADDAPAA